MSEILFNTPTIVALIFWLFCVVFFSLSILRKKDDMWNMVIGTDGKLQHSESVLFYWLFLFPMAVFMIFLLSILGLELNQNNVDLIKWVLGCLEAVLFSLLGYDVLKKKKDEV